MKPEALRRAFFEGVPRYRWLETLGRGGVGVVYKALDLELDEVVAIKVLTPDPDRDDDAVLARFKREINLNRKIKHPNIARIHDFGFSGEFPYITMEFIPGRDLWTLIHEAGRLTAAVAVPILRQIARGSEAIHTLGFVHRDLKSQNVIVDANGGVAIVDFGMARGKVNENFTIDSVILGTPHYMSPEQATGMPVDARADIYSIGVIAFEALTGDYPFGGSSPVAIAMKHVNDPVPDTLSGFPDVSPQLREIVLKALAKDPADRFANATDLETELAMLEPAPAPPTPDPGAEALSDEVEIALDSIVLSAADVDSKKRISKGLRLQAGKVAPGSAPVTQVRKGKPLVLVVHGEVRQLLKLATAVCQSGCRTLEVQSGQEALETLMSKPVDAVLMDVALDGMDGFDVARVIRSQPGLSSVPILLASARPDRSQLAFAVQSGALDLLPLDVAVDVLGERLWKVLAHRGFLPPGEKEKERASGAESTPRSRRRRS